MGNGHLQIRGIKKTDEGMYNCEARVMARGEIDFRMIKVVVNGKHYISVTLCPPPVLLLKNELLLNIVMYSNDNQENNGNVLFKALNIPHIPFTQKWWQQFVSSCVQLFGPDQDTQATTCQIVVKFGIDIHGPKRMDSSVCK